MLCYKNKLVVNLPHGIFFIILLAQVFTTLRASPLNTTNYCPLNTTQQQTEDLFKRTLVMGASFSHACASCEIVSKFSQFLKETDDFGWPRRNFFVQHIQNLNSQNLSWLVTENDPKSNFSEMFSKRNFPREGYSGNWIFNSQKQQMKLATKNELENIQKNTENFYDESFLVSKGEVRKFPYDNNSFRGGILYQSLPNEAQKTSFKILDWSGDRMRSFEIFKNYGNKNIYKKLMRSGWKNDAERRQIVFQTATRIKQFKPSSIFALDVLFWDSIPQLLHTAALNELSTWPGRLLANRLMTHAYSLGWIEPEMRKRIAIDFMRTLEIVATPDSSGNSTPVFIGKLIPEPSKTIAQLKLEKDYGNLLGSLTKGYFGIDFSKELGDAFEKGLAPHEPHISQNGEYDPIDSLLPPAIGKPINLIAGRLIHSALPDLPKILIAADTAFSAENEMYEEYFEKTSANVHLVNLQHFFEIFHTVLHPRTVHPSVEGAEKIASMLPAALCQ
jgi:hypothetical protein